jgi:hypothetical protein
MKVLERFNVLRITTKSHLKQLLLDARMIAQGHNIASPYGMKLALAIHQKWEVICYGPDGKLKWSESFPNLVVNVGLDEYLDRIYNSGAFTSADFVGLKDTGTIVAGDTMASHVGWAIIPGTTYSNANDPSYSPAAASSQSVTNTASKAVFNIIDTDTIVGAILKDDNTKAGATGILLGGNDFAAPRGVGNGDTLNVTMTASLTSS